MKAAIALGKIFGKSTPASLKQRAVQVLCIGEVDTAEEATEVAEALQLFGLASGAALAKLHQLLTFEDPLLNVQVAVALQALTHQ